MTGATYPTELADRVMHAWSKAGFGVMQVGLELTFDRPLDAARLAVAFERLRQHEPLVGCRFAEDGRGGRSWWEPVASYRPLVVTGEREVCRRFLVTPVRAGEEAQLKACLEQSGAGARLCILMSHELADAGGLKDLAALVARFYAEPDVPLGGPARGSRSMAQVLERFTRRELLGAALDGARMLARTRWPGATVHTVQTGAAADGFRWVVEHVERDAVTALGAWGRRFGATLNDLLTAAFLTATGLVSEARPGGRLRMMSTVDLRRYLPGKRATRPCNLSGFEVLTLPPGAGRTLEDALVEVVRQTRTRKRRLIGLAGVAGAPLFERVGQGRLDALFRTLFAAWRGSDNLVPSLTNMGAIDGGTLRFDGRPPASAWLIVPPHPPPHVGVGVSGYDGTLTLAAAATPSFAPWMQAFLQTISGLLSGAGAGRERMR